MENYEWVTELQKESEQLGAVLFANFKHAMELAIKHAPDQLNPQHRAKVFETVVQAWLGAAVIPIATFGNTTKEIENLILDEIRLKFEWIRKNEKDLQLARMDKISEERKLIS